MGDKSETVSLESIIAEASSYQSEVKVVQTVQLIVFQLAGHYFALSIDQVREIVPRPQMAQIPQTPDFVKGVSNVRGSIVALMDIESKFEVAKKDEAAVVDYKYAIILESESHKAGILVKEVPNTIKVPVDHIRQSSEIMQYSALDKGVVEGIVKYKDELIIIVNINQMIDSESIELPTFDL